ncbi:hypothetical protein L462_01731 [Enterobacter sp. BIDMC 26]|nr:hypothetical protein L462_01731 [Enterobacter sp. BIDMC 26]
MELFWINGLERFWRKKKSYIFQPVKSKYTF